MAITSALVLYAVIWFMALFVVLPLRLRTQGDVGKVAPGTPAGAPSELNLMRKLRIVTVAAFVLWLIIAGTIISGIITIDDVDLFHRFQSRQFG